MKYSTLKLLVCCCVAALCLAGCGTMDTVAEADNKAYAGNPQVIPGVVEAEHYDEGGPGEAYYDVDEENQGAPYRENTQVDIEKRSDASNGYGVGWARAGEWLNYTVHVKESGTYNIEIPVASNGKGGTFHLEVDGQNITGEIDVPDTGAWTNLELIQVENVALEQGIQTIKLVMDTIGESGATADIDCLRFTLAE